jgi:hypothetical protein
MFGLARIVDQNIAPVVTLAVVIVLFNVGSDFFVIMISLVIDLILRMFGGSLGDR